MTLMLKDKVILITGACGKLGKSSVKIFLERGASIIAADLIQVAEHPAMIALREVYGEDRLLFVQADVTDELQVERLMERVKSQFGRLDGSFHNAYKQIHRLAADYTLEEWQSVVHGTLTSTFLVCKHAIKLMIASGGGVILNTSSILGERPQMKCAAYGAAKAAINQFTRVLALEYATYGIRANCIVPGDFKDAKLNLNEDHLKRMREMTSIGRSGTADEISELAAFLLSDRASYITGSMHTIDGGFRL